MAKKVEKEQTPEEDTAKSEKKQTTTKRKTAGTVRKTTKATTKKETATKQPARAKTTSKATKTKTGEKAKPAKKVVSEEIVAKTSESKVDAEPQSRYIHGTGRRKTAIATVKLYNTPGTGKITVNEKTIEEVLQVDSWVKQALRPIDIAELTGNVTIVARSYGGGKHGQAEALSLATARALVGMNAELRPLMRRNGLLTRNSKMRESKKYGLKRARKAPQYTKR